MTTRKGAKRALKIIDYATSLGGGAIATSVTSNVVGSVGGAAAQHGQTGLMKISKAYPAYGSIAGAAIGTDLIQGAFVKPRRRR